MERPNKSFIIWFSPRTGSTVICKTLEQIGIAGKAGELLNIPERTGLLEHFKVDSYGDLRATLWEMGSSENGVFGLKYSAYAFLHSHLANELQKIQNLPQTDPLSWSNFEDLFPNCTYIYLYRRNTIRQAVSWWKAIQDNEWHRKKGEANTDNLDFYLEKYNFDALNHLFKEIQLRNAYAQSYFDFNAITPLSIAYEDFAASPQNAIQKITNHMGLKDQTSVNDLAYSRTSNQGSETWVQRFREDLQKDWERKMW